MSVEGNLNVTGNITATGTVTGSTKNFRIDDPLDPDKYLYHASVESSEMANVYSGNVTLNRWGEAVVNLPDKMSHTPGVSRSFRPPRSTASDQSRPIANHSDYRSCRRRAQFGFDLAVRLG